jgi:hypothetical protein
MAKRFAAIVLTGMNQIHCNWTLCCMKRLLVKPHLGAQLGPGIPLIKRARGAKLAFWMTQIVIPIKILFIKWKKKHIPGGAKKSTTVWFTIT